MRRPASSTLFPYTTLFRSDGNRSGQYGSHAPLRNVGMMAAPIGDLAAGIIENPAKVYETPRRGIGRFGRWPEPHIVIETIGNRLGVLPIAGFPEIGRTARQTASHGLQLADAAVANDFASLTKPRIGALLAPTLKDPVVGFHGVTHGAAFGDGERKRLLPVNILTRARRFNHGNRMPVIRQGDENGIDILARDHFAEVVVGGAAFVQAGPLVASIVPFNQHPRRLAPRDRSVPIPRSLAVPIPHGHPLNAHAGGR